jgi:hypothetical protein
MIFFPEVVKNRRMNSSFRSANRPANGMKEKSEVIANSNTNPAFPSSCRLVLNKNKIFLVRSSNL